MSNQASGKVCDFFLRGKCKFGDKCRNLHIRPLCKYDDKCARRDCFYDHPSRNIKTAPVLPVKKEEKKKDDIDQNDIDQNDEDYETYSDFDWTDDENVIDQNDADYETFPEFEISESENLRRVAEQMYFVCDHMAQFNEEKSWADYDWEPE